MPSVVTNADGRLEIFCAGADDNIWHNWQTAVGGATWNGWENIGGGGAGLPAAGRNSNGCLEVFDTNDSGNTWHAWQVTPGGGWTPMQELGGIPQASGDKLGLVTTVQPNAAGPLQLFAMALSSNKDPSKCTVWTTWQEPAGWSGWSVLGLAAGGLVSQPCSAIYPDGVVVAFAQQGGNASQIVACQQVTAGVNAVVQASGGYQTVGTSWSQWAPLSTVAPLPNFGWLTSIPAVGTNADGRLEVFVSDINGELWHTYQTSPGSKGPWSQWFPLGGAPAPLGHLCVESNADGRLEVFAKGGAADNAYHIWQTQPDGSDWSAWTFLAPIGGGYPSIAKNADGRLELFAVNNSGNCWHTWQTTPGGSWAPMANLGHPAGTQLQPYISTTPGSGRQLARRIRRLAFTLRARGRRAGRADIGRRSGSGASSRV